MFDTPGHRALRRGRSSQVGQIYLVTTVTRHRKPIFDTYSVAAAACATLGPSVAASKSQLLCWVLMPDHLHLLVTLCGEASLSAVVNRIKSQMAQAANRTSGRFGRVWAKGFHDRAIRNEEEILPIARYVVANPLRAGLVSRVLDYPFWDAEWL